MNKKYIKYGIFGFLLLALLGIIYLVYYLFVKQDYFGKTDFEDSTSHSGNLINRLVDENGNEINVALNENGDVIDYTGAVSDYTGVSTGSNEYDNETLDWIDKLKKKAKISTNQEPQVLTSVENKTVSFDPKQSMEFIKGLEKKPFNIKGYYFGIVYGLGMENEWGIQTTDSIKIFVYNENTKKLVIFGLPRDWQIEYEGKTMKLDFLFHDIKSRGNDDKKALELTTNYISKMLDIPLNYYLMIDFTAFKEFIDEIGGVDVCIDKNLKWENKLLLEKGCYTLDGDLALKIARVRKQDNDFFRIFRQNNMIYSIIDKAKTMSIVQLFKVVQIYMKRVYTNLNVGEMMYILDNFNDFSDKKQVILNSQCNFYRGIFGMNFCFFYGTKEYYLKEFVDTSILSHYLKTMIMYPELEGCEVAGQGTYLQKLNLMNLGVKLNNRTFKVRQDFKIDSLSGCDEKGVNYFLNIGN